MALPTLSYGERAVLVSTRATEVTIYDEGPPTLGPVVLAPFAFTPLDADLSVASVVDSAVTAGDVRYLIRRLPAL